VNGAIRFEPERLFSALNPPLPPTNSKVGSSSRSRRSTTSSGRRRAANGPKDREALPTLRLLRDELHRLADEE
jgi:hypothetical protein